MGTVTVLHPRRVQPAHPQPSAVHATAVHTPPADAGRFHAGQHVHTPDGDGWVHTVRVPRPGTDAPVKSVTVCFHDRPTVQYPDGAQQAYRPNELAPFPPHAEPDLDVWMGAHRTPRRRPARTPDRSRRTRRLTDEQLNDLWRQNTAAWGTPAQRAAALQPDADVLAHADTCRRGQAPHTYTGPTGATWTVWPEHTSRDGRWAAYKIRPGVYAVCSLTDGSRLPVTHHGVNLGTSHTGDVLATMAEARELLAVIDRQGGLDPTDPAARQHAVDTYLGFDA